MQEIILIITKSIKFLILNEKMIKMLITNNYKILINKLVKIIS